MGIVPGSYSGVRKNLFSNLSKKHDIVEIFDSRLSRTNRYYSHILSYIRATTALNNLPSYPVQWENLTDKNSWRWLKGTHICESKVNRSKKNIDFILQVGSKHGIFLGNKHAVPYVVYTDGTMEMETRENGDPLYRLLASNAERSARLKLEKSLYQNASLVFTFSEFARKSIINDYEIDENKVTTVYTGPNIKEIPSSIEKDYSNKTILFVGRDFHRKGGPTLIKAFEKVKEIIKDTKLIIVGSEPNLFVPNRINTMFDLFGLKMNFQRLDLKGLTVTGYITDDELINIYRKSSIFVMPSIQENFGHVFLEAMAYQMPCIGSTVDAIPEIIEEGKTGFLVYPNNPEQLAEKLIQLLEDENLMKEMGNKGKKRVEKNFTWDLVVDRMNTQFEKIINPNYVQ